jgi:hypothetical protein
MSNKTLSFALGFALIYATVAGIILTLLSMILMWLVPVATAGAIHITWLQGLGILTLAAMARLILFPTK